MAEEEGPRKYGTTTSHLTPEVLPIKPTTKRSNDNSFPRSGDGGGAKPQSKRQRRRARRLAKAFKAPVKIQPEWKMIDVIPFSDLSSKPSLSVPEAEDLRLCGSVKFYDQTWDSINAFKLLPLNRFKTTRTNLLKVTPTLSVDQVIGGEETEDGKVTVFATERTLATLMCATKSVYSWDVVVERIGNKVYFDKRAGSLDLISVHENNTEQPLPEAPDDINSAYSLNCEAAYINQNFARQVLNDDGDMLNFDGPNPFPTEEVEQAAPVAYRYRRWKLENDATLVARCEFHSASVMGDGDEVTYLTLNALNEFDIKYSGLDWMMNLGHSSSTVLANELKYNTNKLAKWSAQALLAGADMKLGFVSRVHPRNQFDHDIFAVKGYKPSELLSKIHLNQETMWGIVNSIVNFCVKLNEGKYLLLKDPIEPQVAIYQVPNDAFQIDYSEGCFCY